MTVEPTTAPAQTPVGNWVSSDERQAAVLLERRTRT